MYPDSSVASAPFIKAAARDIKAFRDARQYRQIPVAYTTGDEVAYRATVATYLACGDQSDGIDLYGLATYSWCGNSSVYDSGYDQIYEEFEGLNMPVLFSEVGCNWIEPRVFTEVETILGTVFPATFSGAMVYEWSETNDDYGIVSYTQANYKGFPTTMGGYDTLKTVLANANPVSTAATGYTPSISPPACPTSNTNWPLDGSIPLPTIAGLDLSTVTPITTTLTGADSIAAATSWLAGITSTATAPIDDGSSSNTEPLPRIAVTGISVAVAAILSAIIFFFRFRRIVARRKTTEKTTNNDTQQSEEDVGRTDKPELPAISSSRIAPKSELDACVDSIPESPSSPTVVHDKSPDHPLELGSHHCARYPLEMKGSLPIICEIDGKEKQYP